MWWALTANGCRRAFDGEQHGEHGVGDAVVDHITLPGDFDVAAGLDEDVDTVHDCELGACAADVFVCVLLDAVAVGLFALDCIIGDIFLFDCAKGALEGPANQLCTCSGQGQVLTAHYCGRCETRVLLKVFGRHE